MLKNHLSLTLALFSVLFFCSLLTSCKKDSDDSSNSKPSSNAFTAKVDGADWKAGTTGATYLHDIFVLSAKSSSGAVLVLRVRPMKDYETMGPMVLFRGSDDNVGVYLESESDSLAYATNQYSGRAFDMNYIQFTKFDKAAKKVSGTFSFIVERTFDGKTKTISGTFTDIVYDDKVPPTPDKTMTAKVDGNSWSATSVMGVYNSFASSVSIVGNASNGTTIGLNIPVSAKAGSEYTPSSFGTTRAQYNPSSSTFRFADEGKITVTFHDKDAKVMKGTFSFLAEDSQEPDANEITEGSFVVTY